MHKHCFRGLHSAAGDFLVPPGPPALGPLREGVWEAVGTLGASVPGAWEAFGKHPVLTVERPLRPAVLPSGVATAMSVIITIRLTAYAPYSGFHATQPAAVPSMLSSASQ